MAFLLLAVPAWAQSPVNANATQPSAGFIVQPSVPTFTQYWEYPKIQIKGECVPYARVLTGVNKYGDAITWKPNSAKPTLGAVVIFTYGHIGAVYAIDPIKEEILITEKHFIGDTISTRSLSFNDTTIKGYVDKLAETASKSSNTNN